MQPEVLYMLHPAAQASVPPSKPSEVHVAPPSIAPSHVSLASSIPLPQLEQPVVTNALHPGAHASVPPSKPIVAQVSPSRSVPSHSSVPPTSLLPQVKVHPVVT